MDSSIQMRLYTLSKPQFVLTFVTFIAVFVVTVLASIAGPNIINTSTVNTSQMINNPKPENFATGPFMFMSPVLSTFSQQVWLMGNIKIDKLQVTSVSQTFTLQAKIYAVSHDASVANGVQVHNRTRTLHCTKSNCDSFMVLHLGYLEYTRLRVEISFYDLEGSSIQNVFFQFKTYNPVFTQVEIWFRFVFLVLAFLVTCIFAHSLRCFHMRDWTIEQKWMSVLLPLLLLYNDPIFPLGFLISSSVPLVLDTIFQATFLCTLLMFWLCVYHGVRSEKRQFVTFYLPKIVVCGLLWLSSVTLGVWQQYNEMRDPTYQYKLDIKNYVGMRSFFYIICAVYLLYLMFLLIRACTELKSKPFFAIRIRFLTVLTVFVLCISIAVIVLKFGSSMLQDNFVADISTQYNSTAEFVCFYALLNYYLFTMAFVYSPSKNALYDVNFTDRPTFSLLNESDEEVLYGSDQEDTPLSNGKIRRPELFQEFE